MGEAEFGLVEGVLSTRAAWLEKHEVVEVEFDPEVVKYADLLKHAREHDCATVVYTRSDDQQKEAEAAVGKKALRSDKAVTPDKEPKYYVGKTHLKFVPMTEMQAMRVCGYLGKQRKDWNTLLSPSQLKLLEAVKAKPDAGWKDAIGKPLLEAWQAAQATAAGKKTEQEDEF